MFSTTTVFSIIQAVHNLAPEKISQEAIEVFAYKCKYGEHHELQLEASSLLQGNGMHRGRVSL
jgi:hypothetical protein